MTTERQALARAIDDHLTAQDAVRFATDALAKARAYADGIARNLRVVAENEGALIDFQIKAVKAALADGREPDIGIDSQFAAATRDRDELTAKARAADAAIRSLERDLAGAQAEAERLDRERQRAAERVVIAEAEAAADGYRAAVQGLRAVHYRLAALAGP